MQQKERHLLETFQPALRAHSIHNPRHQRTKIAGKTGFLKYLAPRRRLLALTILKVSFRQRPAAILIVDQQQQRRAGRIVAIHDTAGGKLGWRDMRFAHSHMNSYGRKILRLSYFPKNSASI